MDKGIKEKKLAALVALSDPLWEESRADIDRLESVLAAFNLECIRSAWLFEEAAPEHKAAELNGFFGLSDIDYIFDLSGGNLANTVLEYLDYDIIRDSGAVFFGYSDLSTVINALYTVSDKKSVLYQVRNLIGTDEQWQQIRFADFVLSNGSSLFEFPFEFVRGEAMQGVVVGGNIRCTLKLCGTKYFPKLAGNILLIESLGGDLYSTMSQLTQLKAQSGFSDISGLLLGTFTKIEKQGQMDRLLDFISENINADIPIARTSAIGHGDDSSAAYIGRRIILEDEVK